MASQSVEALVEGGKATAAPPLGPALGPLGVNIGQVVVEINKKTDAFKGMQVPIKVTVDSATKTFTVSVGTPPASALIKKEAGIEKGSGKPKTDLVADLKMEQVIKVAKMKEADTLGNDAKAKVKEVIGTCRSMGIMVEGVSAAEAMALVESGKFDEKIKSGKTELSAEEKKALDEERRRLQEELKARYAELDAIAQRILKETESQTASVKRAKLKEAGIPEDMIHKLVPQEKAAPDKGGAPAKAPAKK